MYIKRALDKIIKQNFATTKSIALVGARQVGKTTAITHLFPHFERINMMDNFLYNVAKEDTLQFIKSYKTPLFIDEIQKAPFILEQMKVVLDETRKKSLYLFSGSQKWEVMKGLSEALPGMVSVLEMTTLSLREINKIDFNLPFSLNKTYLDKRENKLHKYNNVWHFIHLGFYPELYDNNPRSWQAFYSSYVRTYIEKDVYDILRIKDSNMFYKFMVSVAARTGCVLNYSNIANDIGVDSDTIKSWVSVLEKTGIVYLLQPYYNSHLSRAIKTPKLYFRDTGLCAYLTNWHTEEQLKNGAMNGAFFETFVVNEILKSYINAGFDYNHYVYYYRGKDKIKNNVDHDGEIDLIIEENNTIYPIEIKKNANVKASMASYFSILDKDISKQRGPGAIICTCNKRINLRDNLVALPIEYI